MRSQGLRPQKEDPAVGDWLASELYLGGGTLEVRCVSLEGITVNKLGRRDTHTSFTPSPHSPQAA